MADNCFHFPVFLVKTNFILTNYIQDISDTIKAALTCYCDIMV